MTLKRGEVHFLKVEQFFHLTDEKFISISFTATWSPLTLLLVVVVVVVVTVQIDGAALRTINTELNNSGLSDDEQ